MPLPKVVVIGAGFGALSCARALAGKPVDLLLVDRHNYHLFTPLLYQVASSLLNPSDIAYPIRAVFRRARNVRVRVGEVVGADFDGHWVAVRDRDGGAVQRLAYEYLVLAPGSNSNFFGNVGIATASHGLKDLPEALELRNHVLRCFEAASREPDEVARRPWLTFAIVGGGPTGVEYAGALVELIRLVLVKDYPELNLRKVHIVLVEARDQILPAFPKALGDDAELRLRQRGIDVRLNTRVESVAGDAITLSGGQRLRSPTLVGGAGEMPQLSDRGHDPLVEIPERLQRRAATGPEDVSRHAAPLLHGRRGQLRHLPAPVRDRRDVPDGEHALVSGDAEGRVHLHPPTPGHR